MRCLDRVLRGREITGGHVERPVVRRVDPAAIEEHPGLDARVRPLPEDLRLGRRRRRPRGHRKRERCERAGWLRAAARDQLPRSGALVVNGQGGNNTLVGPNGNETWHVTGTNAGNVGGVSFSNVQNLTGGTGNDLFVFSNGKGVAGTINGGSGTNELDYAAYTSAVTVNLASHTATGTGGFSSIETLAGGTGSNKLIGPNATNTWNITGNNAGTVGGVTFSAFPNLTGGTGMDVFEFSAGKNVTGAINGGGGGDWLDYALYTTAVAVNLKTGAATGVAGGVTNIQNVRAGSGGCTLTGDSQGNILIGGSGAVTINGGTGRSVLIADKGAGHVSGGSGTDILIGAKTSYDASTIANDIALADILAEWQSGHNYLT